MLKNSKSLRIVKRMRVVHVRQARRQNKNYKILRLHRSALQRKRRRENLCGIFGFDWNVLNVLILFSTKSTWQSMQQHWKNVEQTNKEQQRHSSRLHKKSFMRRSRDVRLRRSRSRSAPRKRSAFKCSRTMWSVPRSSIPAESLQRSCVHRVCVARKA